MYARVNSSSLARRGILESENQNLSAKDEKDSVNTESVPQKPDFESLLAQVDKLESELENERKKNAEQISRMKYLQADLINMQKQADRMVSEAKTSVKMSWIWEIISIKEDLDRALKSASSEKSHLVDGLKLLSSRIENDLKVDEILPINVEVGSKFDPKIHEAVHSQETDDVPEGSIISVIANGYTVGGKVIKPALVEVARRKPPVAPKETEAPKEIKAPEETPAENPPEKEL
jgi:molecular chaperone GrpE